MGQLTEAFDKYKDSKGKQKQLESYPEFFTFLLDNGWGKGIPADVLDKAKAALKAMPPEMKGAMYPSMGAALKAGLGEYTEKLRENIESITQSPSDLFVPMHSLQNKVRPNGTTTNESRIAAQEMFDILRSPQFYETSSNLAVPPLGATVSEGGEGHGLPGATARQPSGRAK